MERYMDEHAARAYAEAMEREAQGRDEEALYAAGEEGTPLEELLKKATPNIHLDGSESLLVLDARGRIVAGFWGNVPENIPPVEGRANAVLYVHMRNTYEGLVKALEKQFEGEHGLMQHIRSCSRGYVVHRPPTSDVTECDDPYCEAARQALAAARTVKP